MQDDDDTVLTLSLKRNGEYHGFVLTFLRVQNRE
jgi:hypothetical protein